jgi:hypothetical protein
MIKRVVCVVAIAALLVGRVSVELTAAGLDVQVKNVHAEAQSVRATIELRDLVPDRFKKMLDEGTPLHLRVQAELWESRPVWDQLVYPAIIRMVRFVQRAASRDIAIDDASGSTAVRAIPNPMAIDLDLGSRGRIATAGRYYVHVVATLGTVADRDIDAAEDAVFGRESETNSLGSFGRMLFRTAMKMNDYLQSVSAETKSRKIAGADIVKTP